MWAYNYIASLNKDFICWTSFNGGFLWIEALNPLFIIHTLNKINMKHFKLFLTIVLPFLLVYTAWIFSLCSFPIKDVFLQGSAFWPFCIIYWFLWSCLVGPITDAIYEN